MEPLAVVGVLLLIVGIAVFVASRTKRSDPETNAPSSPSDFGPGGNDDGPINKV